MPNFNRLSAPPSGYALKEESQVKDDIPFDSKPEEPLDDLLDDAQASLAQLCQKCGNKIADGLWTEALHIADSLKGKIEELRAIRAQRRDTRDRARSLREMCREGLKD